MKEQDTQEVKVGSIWKSKRTSTLNLILPSDVEGRCNGFNLTRNSAWPKDVVSRGNILRALEFVANSFTEWQAQQKQGPDWSSTEAKVELSRKLEKQKHLMDAWKYLGHTNPQYVVNELNSYIYENIEAYGESRFSLPQRSEDSGRIEEEHSSECYCDSRHLTVFGHEFGCYYNKRTRPRSSSKLNEDIGHQLGCPYERKK